MNHLFNSLLILVMLVLVLGGCDRDDDHLNNANNTLNTLNTLSRSFQRPEDGKLSEQQVAKYIVIRKKIIADVKTQKLAQKTANGKNEPNESTSIDLRHFDEIEIAAAKSFDMSYAEFQWVKDAVIDTQTQMLVQKYYQLNHRILTLLDETVTRYKEINSKEPEQQERQIMNGYVAEIKQEITNLRGKIAEPNESSEALAHNIVVMTKFKKELGSLR